jgi:hypothetical protein
MHASQGKDRQSTTSRKNGQQDKIQDSKIKSETLQEGLPKVDLNNGPIPRTIKKSCKEL